MTAVEQSPATGNKTPTAGNQAPDAPTKEAPRKQPTSWWEWPIVFVALPLVLLRELARWCNRHLRRMAASLRRIVAVAARWVWGRLRAFIRLVAPPVRLLRRVVLVLMRWLSRVPPWVWHLVVALWHWAEPGAQVARRLVFVLAQLFRRAVGWASARVLPPTRRLAVKLWRLAGRAAGWVRERARRPWRYVCTLAGRAMHRAWKVVRGVARIAAWPLALVFRTGRFALSSLAAPARACGRFLGRVSAKFRAAGTRLTAGPWRRLRDRGAAISGRVRAARHGIAARLQRHERREPASRA